MLSTTFRLDLNYCLFVLKYMVDVNWQEMVIWVDINNFKHFPELKTPYGTSGTQETSTPLCGLLLPLQEVNLRS